MACSSVDEGVPAPQLGVVCGRFTRRLWTHFRSAMDADGRLPVEKAVSVFEAAGLSVSCSQLLEMLHSASLARQSEDDRPGLLFGDFCAFSVALLSSTDCLKATLRCIENSFGERSLIDRYRAMKQVDLREVQDAVFLGGSCNPTTWRRDVVIPMLSAAGVTYYNPQVDSWYPELLEIEREAKEKAQLLFFVVDGQTRAVASMVEVAYFATSHRPLVLVVGLIPGSAGCEHSEVQLDKDEIVDLNNARAFLLDMAERAGVRVFLDEASAVDFSVAALKCEEKAHSAVASSSVRVGSEVLDRKELFWPNASSHDSLTIDDALLAIQAAMSSSCVNVSRDVMQSRLGDKSSVKFQDFLCLVSELQAEAMEEPGWWLKNSLSWIGRCASRALSYVLEKSSALTSPRRAFGVFLGGSCGDTTWRQGQAIPLLEEKNVSYFNPQVEKWSVQCIPKEASAKENCQVLLFVISGETRGAASLAEAAYYIGLGRTVVLCVMDIPEDGKVGGVPLQARARKDYNRGRAYLRDIATQHEVPSFTNVADAVRCAIEHVSKSGC